MAKRDWQWNEMQQVGTDYTSIEEVERYDRRMGEFRDVEAEHAAILRELDLPRGAGVLDLGCGTGRFVRAAARAGLQAAAVDVSPVMLEYARTQAEREGLKIDFRHAGFLTMDFAPGSFDAAVSGAALHHLPDTWKAVALRNVRKTLKPNGAFILRDVVFSFSADGHGACFDAFVESCTETMRPAAARHIAREYSTQDWIMRGLLERAGFRIACEREERPSFRSFLCRCA